MAASACDQRWAASELLECKLSAKYGRKRRIRCREWGHQYKEKEEGRRLVDSPVSISLRLGEYGLMPSFSIGGYSVNKKGSAAHKS